MLWLGPDEWLVVGLPGTAATIVGELEAALEGVHHAVVDVSENRAVLELRGADRFELLASGCSLDLDPRGGWIPGVCAQTMFARAQVILQELAGATRVFVRPSFAALRGRPVARRPLVAAEAPQEQQRHAGQADVGGGAHVSEPSPVLKPSSTSGSSQPSIVRPAAVNART